MKRVALTSRVSVLILAMVMALLACTEKPSDKNKKLDRPVSPSETYMLSDEEVKKLSEQAMAGDGDAAFELFLFYTLTSKKDFKKGFYWLKRAAENGHVVAQYNLGSFSLDKNIPADVFGITEEDRKKGRYWLREAAKNGHPKANELLNEFDKEKKARQLNRDASEQH